MVLIPARASGGRWASNRSRVSGSKERATWTSSGQIRKRSAHRSTLRPRSCGCRRHHGGCPRWSLRLRRSTPRGCAARHGSPRRHPARGARPGHAGAGADPFHFRGDAAAGSSSAGAAGRQGAPRHAAPGSDQSGRAAASAQAQRQLSDAKLAADQLQRQAGDAAAAAGNRRRDHAEPVQRGGAQRQARRRSSPGAEHVGGERMERARDEAEEAEERHEGRARSGSRWPTRSSMRRSTRRASRSSTLKRIVAIPTATSSLQ